MREIKFRSWDSFNQTMTFSDEKCVKGGNDPILMQFTGLKDKNGKEIYEGDILCSTNPKEIFVKFIVQWGYRDNPYSWGFKSILTESIYEFCDHKETMQVIGNIYENGDLLKDGKYET